MQHVSEKIREYTEELGSISPNPAWARKAQVAPPLKPKWAVDIFIGELIKLISEDKRSISGLHIYTFLFTFACSSQKYIYIYIYMCDEFTYVEHVYYIYIDIIYLCVIMCIHTCFLVHMCTHVFFQVQISVGMPGNKTQKNLGPQGDAIHPSKASL